MKRASLMIGMMFFCLLFLAACIGVEIKFIFNATGSGRFLFQYKISQELSSLLEANSLQNQILPDISRESVEKRIKATTGLKLLNFEKIEDERAIYINGEIEFSSLEALQKSKIINLPCSLKQEGNRSVLRIKYVNNQDKNNQDKLDAQMLDLVRLLFNDYEMRIIVEAPRKITASNEGSLSSEGRTLTLVYKIEDYIQLEGERELKISW